MAEKRSASAATDTAALASSVQPSTAVRDHGFVTLGDIQRADGPQPLASDWTEDQFYYEPPVCEVCGRTGAGNVSRDAYVKCFLCVGLPRTRGVEEYTFAYNPNRYLQVPQRVLHQAGLPVGPMRNHERLDFRHYPPVAVPLGRERRAPGAVDRWK